MSCECVIENRNYTRNMVRKVKNDPEIENIRYHMIND